MKEKYEVINAEKRVRNANNIKDIFHFFDKQYYLLTTMCICK